MSPALGLADTGTEVLTNQISKANADDIGFSNGSVVVAPIPFRNELVGAGLALGLGYLLKTDEASDTSMIGVGALRSENGSEAFAATASFAFHENTWKLNLTAGQADMFYDLYIGNLKFPVNQDGTLINAELLHQAWQDTHIGGRLRYLDTNLAYDTSSPGLPALPLVNAELVSLSALLQWDTRDDTFSARSGHYLDVEVMHGELLNQSNSGYQKLTTRFNAYRALGPKNSVALRATACMASSSAPFFDKCSLGGTDGFRGYNPTRFLNSRLLSFQGELRHNFTDRLSGVAFAGIGFSGPSFDRLDNGGGQIAGGLGGRFQLSKKFKAMFSVDVARNEVGENTLYVYVGQRF
ncbi:BamA/TamA family outer membrane protein [Shimia sp. Alg240-R146]|uniref:BamA/TamA family outer membrane protein n=1 Tax=Shimia sp. Alg240-R146 TaxID=2993449 RepID=UPI0022E715CC|nr:BamA/TamA family outer membrane protein [Shimia sp. Alg240-R146]